MSFKTYWPLMLFLMGTQGWVLTFPLYGSLLFTFIESDQINPQQIVPIFLFFFFVFYIIWGAVLAKWQPKAFQLRNLIFFVLIAMLLFSLSLYWLPHQWWLVCFALLGSLSPLASLVWLSIVTQRASSGEKGFIFGITGFAIEVLLVIVNILADKLPQIFVFILIQLLIVMAMFIFYKFPSVFQLRENHPSSVKGSWKSSVAVFALIYIVFLVGGVMYEAVNPYLVGYPQLFTYYANVPYALMMIIVGLFADRLGMRAIAFFGVVALGLAYTIFAITEIFALSTPLVAAVSGNTLIRIGFAFMDFFVLFALSSLAPSKNTVLFLGLGLGVYILSILSGMGLSQALVPLLSSQYLVIYFIAITILFLSFLIIEWVGRSDRLGDAQLAEYSAVDEELRLAREVQQSMLPKLEEIPKGLEIQAKIRVAREVGGDFYDVLRVSQHQTLLVIGDVMGKGLPAAMIVSSVVGLIRSEVHYGRSLNDTLQHLNRMLINNSRISMFVTVSLTLIDRQRESLTYISAGHLYPYLITADGYKQIEHSSIPLGIDLDIDFKEITLPFRGRDVFFQYTDGVVEIKNNKQEMFGFDGIEKIITDISGVTSVKEFATHLENAILEFSQSLKLEDDLTYLIVKNNS